MPWHLGSSLSTAAPSPFCFAPPHVRASPLPPTPGHPSSLRPHRGAPRSTPLHDSVRCNVASASLAHFHDFCDFPTCSDVVSLGDSWVFWGVPSTPRVMCRWSGIGSRNARCPFCPRSARDNEYAVGASQADGTRPRPRGSFGRAL